MLRLLIVDDEEIIRESLAAIADWPQIGYELVGTAANGMDAYDILRDEYPDVVITDIRMPVLDGIELIERARSLDPGIRFIILSGYGDFDYARQAMRFGVRHYLLKPTDRQQVLDALNDIREDHLRSQQLAEQENQLRVSNVLFTLQKCLLVEALHSHGELGRTLDKYRNVMEFPSKTLQLCICSYLEEANLRQFLRDVERFGGQLVFPVIYVNHVAVLMTGFTNLAAQTMFAENVRDLQYRGQKVPLDVHLQEFSDFPTLLATMLAKIRRYGRILLGSQTQEVQEISNRTGMLPLESWALRIQSAKGVEDLRAVLSEAYEPMEGVPQAVTMAINLSMCLRTELAEAGERSREMLPQFIDELGRCGSIPEVSERTLLHLMSVMGRDPHEAGTVKSSMESLKQYIDQHLHEDNLSLKWLAENHLYVSVGYLSKLFTKEVGERFSDYLNTRRMEKAKKLLLTYSSGNIRDVAEAVGFGSNPRYFGQVFKKYTGMTPSEFVERS